MIDFQFKTNLFHTSIMVGSKIGGGVGAFSLIVNGGGVGGGGAVCLFRIQKNRDLNREFVF